MHSQQTIKKKISTIIATTVVVIISLSSFAQNTAYDNSFIRFHIYGKGEPVFVLSGGPGNDCHQEEDVAVIIGRYYQSILLEQRGTGQSMPPLLNKHTINLDAYIKDILFVMDSLKITKAKFYGHSWGAMYASAFATRFPDKVASLVLTGPGYIKLNKEYENTIIKNRMAKLSDKQRRRFNEFSKKNLEKLTVDEEEELSNLRITFNTYDTTNREWKFAKIKKGISNKTTNELLMKDLERIKFDLTEQLKTLKMPISIITCKEDPLAFLTTEYHKYTPQAKVYWMEKCGHFPMYEQPDKFYPLLVKALNL